MRRSRKLSLGALVVVAVTSAGASPAASRDPLAAEIGRWSSFLKTNTSKDEMWTQVQEATEPVIARAEEALRKGRRILALQPPRG